MGAASGKVRSRLKLLRVLALALALSSAAQASDGEAADDGLPNLLPMPQIEVPIVDAGQIRGALRVKLVLEMADQTAAFTVGDDMPALRSASVAAASEFARLHASAFRAVNAEELRAAMTAALPGRSAGIARVLIVEVAATNA